MDTYREKVYHRGTTDCPFQQYHLKCTLPNITLTATHWHPEYEILYIQTGSIELKSDKQTSTLFPNDIAFIQPEWLHSIKTLEENTSYYAFVFSLDLLTLPRSHFFQKEVIAPIASGTHQFPPVLRDNDTHYASIASALNDLVVCNTQSPARKAVVFSSILQVFLKMADSLLPCSTQKKRNNETVKIALQYMNTHFADHLTLQQLAEHVHLHPNYLCALFKGYTGQTAFYHLNRIRIENAAELLRTGKVSVSEAATRCGFDSTGFFTRKFKEYIGLSPKEYSIMHR